MIPVNLMRQYSFCPRIVYFSLLTDIKPIYPRHVRQGEAYHDLQVKLNKTRGFRKLNIHYDKLIVERYFEDNLLGLGGKVDAALICEDEVIPLEFKDMHLPKISRGHRLQLYGYGHLLSKYYQRPFRRAFVIYSTHLRFREMHVDQKLESDFFKTFYAIATMVDKSFFPDSSASEAQCAQCEYLNFCDDRF